MRSTWNYAALMAVALLLACGSGGADSDSAGGTSSADTAFAPLKVPTNDAATPLFDPLVVHELTLTLSEATLALMTRHEWAQGTFHLAGQGVEIGPAEVWLRLKGREGASFQLPTWAAHQHNELPQPSIC